MTKTKPRKLTKKNTAAANGKIPREERTFGKVRTGVRAGHATGHGHP
jgi:hypothetical protein